MNITPWALTCDGNVNKHLAGGPKTWRCLVKYTSDFAYITAYRNDRRESENRRLMKSLKHDLLTKGHKLIHCMSSWYGRWQPIYIIFHPLDIQFFLDLSRKYGQNLLLFRGDVYDVATGNVIGKVNETYRKTPPGKKHPRWICMNNYFYVRLDFSESVNIFNTLNAWSSGAQCSISEGVITITGD